jgi:hypothetical protein
VVVFGDAVLVDDPVEGAAVAEFVVTVLQGNFGLDNVRSYAFLVATY